MKDGQTVGTYNVISGSTWVGNLEAGTYTATFTVDPSYKYYKNMTITNTIPITVKGYQSVIEADDVTAFFNEGKVIAKVTNTAGEAIVGGDVFISIGYLGETLKTNSQGIMEFDLGDLENGEYDAFLRFEGNDIYDSCSKYIKVKIYQIDTEILADDISFTYGENGKLTATLKELNGAALKNLNLKIDIGTLKTTLTTNTNGQVTLDLSKKLAGDEYDGLIYFEGTNKYAKSNATVKVNIKKVPTSITASDITCDYDDGTNLVATLKDENGNPMKNAEVTLNAGGQILTATTDENGQVKLPVSKLAAKNYTATISFNGNDGNAASSIDVNVNVKQCVAGLVTKITAPSIVTTYNVGKNLVITLKDENGKAVKNVKLNVKFNGKNKALTTDSNGQVKISSYNLAPNTYKAVITFAGVAHKYLPTNFTAKVVVKKASPKLTAKSKSFAVKTKTKKYTVTLKNNKGKVMKNTKLTLKVKSKTYTVKTNSKGVATFKITNLSKKGKFKALIKYAGSKYYKSASKIVYITAK